MLSSTDPFDRALAELVAPPTWQNPRVTGRYDLVVLGGGTAGLVAAIGAAVVGARVALVERELLGGDCLTFGCVPSKALLHAARLAHAARTSVEVGLDGEASRVRFEVVMRHLRETRVKIAPHDAARTLAQHGVDVFFGEGKLSGRDTVEVAGQHLPFVKALLATGTKPAVPAIDGLVETGFLTNETIFGLTALPERLVVLGGGPVGCELGQAFRRLGSEVTIVGRDPRLLPKDEEDASLALRAAFEREGIGLVLGATVTRARSENGRKVLVTSDGLEIEGDALLVAVGRTPSTRGLGLEEAGIDVGERGIVLDDHLRTTNADVYAAGDVASEEKLTHAAEAMARAALTNALFFGRSRRSELVIPHCTFTDPELAHVGIDRAEARRRGKRVVTLQLPLGENDRAAIDGNDEGFVRVHLTRWTGRILGATIVGRGAGELLAPLVLAMSRGLPMSAFTRAIFPYPTTAEIWRRLADEHARTLFRPWMKRLIARLLSWRRAR